MRRRTSVLAATLFATLAGYATPPSTHAADRSTALSVLVECSTDSRTCSATASGGSGGYTFEWSSNVTVQYEADDYSWGDVDCYGYWGWVGAGVTVRDGSGAIASGSGSIYCTP